MKIRAWTIAVLSLALSVSAFAANKGRLKLRQATLVGGTELAAGEYKVTWEDGGALTVTQGKDVKAKAQAKVVAQPNSVLRTEVMTEKTSTGKIRVKSIQFEGSKSLIVLDEAGQAAN